MNRECACCGRRLLATYNGDLCSICRGVVMGGSEEAVNLDEPEYVDVVKLIGLKAFDNYLEV